MSLELLIPWKYNGVGRSPKNNKKMFRQNISLN
jgi:hypothetical protein